MTICEKHLIAYSLRLGETCPACQKDRLAAAAVSNSGRIPATLAEAVGLKPATVPHDGKDDKGKPNPALLFEGCAGALAEVSKVLDGGAGKYAADSWQRVPDGIKRYKAAFYRHLQDMQVNGWDSVNTADFGLLHLDHAITDLLFIRSLMLKQKESNAI